MTSGLKSLGWFFRLCNAISECGLARTGDVFGLFLLAILLLLSIERSCLELGRDSADRAEPRDILGREDPLDLVKRFGPVCTGGRTRSILDTCGKYGTLKTRLSSKP